MSQGIYLDYNATTPVHPAVLNKMLPYFSDRFGNPASTSHRYGRSNQSDIEDARHSIAQFFQADKSEIVFTSGATESINLAIKGVFERYKSKGQHFICSSTEHSAVLDCHAFIQSQGAEVSYLNVDKDGLVNLSEIASLLREDTVMVSVMLANNESGIIQDIKAISELVHNNKTILLCDITQALGKIEINLNELGIDLAPFSAHKIYGPKGSGALYVRRKKPRVSLQELIHGGGHERGRRSGTLNVPGIIGLAEAIKHIQFEEIAFIKEVRDHFETALKKTQNIKIISENNRRLPNTSFVQFIGIKSERLITKCAKLAISTGSACTSENPKPSHVLKAMGMTDEETLSCVRFSFGRANRMKEVKEIIEILNTGIKQLI